MATMDQENVRELTLTPLHVVNFAGSIIIPYKVTKDSLSP